MINKNLIISGLCFLNTYLILKVSNINIIKIIFN